VCIYRDGGPNEIYAKVSHCSTPSRREPSARGDLCHPPFSGKPCGLLYVCPEVSEPIVLHAMQFSSGNYNLME